MPQPPRFGGASREAYTPAGAPHPSWRWAQVGPALCRTPLPVRCLRSKSVAPVDSIDIRYSQYSACDLIMIGLPKQFRSVWIYCSTPLCVPYDHKVWGYISVATVGVVCHSCELVSLIQFYVHTLWSYRTNYGFIMYTQVRMTKLLRRGVHSCRCSLCVLVIRFPINK